MNNRNSWHLTCALFLPLSYFILAFASGRVMPAIVDPPLCEVYDVEVVDMYGNLTSGKLQTTTDAYGGHTPGTLDRQTVLTNKTASGPELDTLRIYPVVHMVEVPKGFRFVILPSDSLQKIAMDNVEDIRIENSYGCAQDSSYQHVFPQGIYQLPFESIRAVQNNQLRVAFQDIDVKCWFVLNEENRAQELLKNTFDRIRTRTTWYSEHRAANEELWETEGLALICHPLLW
ncbi:MAG: hypothetical protein AAF564_05060 [Bacteroidota bacterium]